MSLEGIAAQSHWWWLIGGLLLLTLELVAPGVYLVWIGAAALITGLLALLGLPIAAELGIFAVLTIVATMLGRRWYHNNPVTSSDPMLNDRAARLTGEVVTVLDAISPTNGRVKVGDSVWSARGEPAEPGERVRIIGHEGTYLRVERQAAVAGPPAADEAVAHR